MAKKKTGRDLAYMLILDTGIVEKPAGARDAEYALIEATRATIGPIVIAGNVELIIMAAVVKLLERFAPADDPAQVQKIIDNIAKFVSRLEAGPFIAQQESEDAPADAPETAEEFIDDARGE
jgi:hypothetical protein